MTVQGTAKAPTGGMALVERLLALAEAAGAGQAEVVLMGTDSALTRFANSEIHQNVAETDEVASLRFVVGRRVGVASSGRLDRDGLRDLVETAASIARVQPEQEEPVSLPDREAIAPVDGFSASTAAASPERLADGVAAVVSAADDAGALAFGSFTSSTDRLIVANSNDVRAQETTTRARLVAICMGPGGEAGYAESLAVDVSAIDPLAVGREAADRAARCRAPATLAPGEYPVVLEPYAVVDLLDMLGEYVFSALAVEEGRSVFEPGRRIGSELVSTWDDAMDPAGTPTAFDAEGTAKRRVQLIDRGLCVGVVHDAATAARAGRRSTGHGLPAPNTWGPIPGSQFMAPGDATLEQLLAGLDRGVLVTRFNYTNPVHPKRVIVTGMTRDGTFLVEHGEIVGPVRNLRFTQGYLDALAAVEAVGRDRRLLAGALGSCVVPGLRVGTWNFTGGTEH